MVIPLNRDNFGKGVIEKLRLRVGLRCSNPECRVPTAGPTTDPESASVIGVAAHIHAAAPLGPRYDAGMTRAQRRSIDNALWLCASCSTLIDRDAGRFTAPLLRSWKAVAEHQAQKEQLKPQPSSDDAMKQLTAALTGQSTTYYPALVDNAHQATEQALTALDPRFEVTSRRTKHGTHFHLHAKEPINLAVHLPVTVSMSGHVNLNI